MIKVVKKGIVLPFLLFLASAAFIISVLLILDDQPKIKNQIRLQSASPSPTSETENTDKGSVNWKTYTNSKYKYTLNYPTNLRVSSAVESLPGNEALRDLETACCINIVDEKFRTFLQINVLEENRTISQIKNDLEKRSTDIITNINKTKFLNQDALFFNLYGDQKSTTVLKDNYSYEFAVVDQQIADQILATFKFLDQPDEEKLCGTIAGIICPSGYECLYDGNYPDAGGKCAKN